jgi:hypothetical protein
MVISPEPEMAKPPHAPRGPPASRLSDARASGASDLFGLIALALDTPARAAAQIVADLLHVERPAVGDTTEAPAMSADARSACGAGVVDAGANSSGGGTNIRHWLAEAGLRWRWGPTPQRRALNPKPREGL